MLPTCLLLSRSQLLGWFMHSKQNTHACPKLGERYGSTHNIKPSEKSQVIARFLQLSKQQPSPCHYKMLTDQPANPYPKLNQYFSWISALFSILGRAAQGTPREESNEKWALLHTFGPHLPLRLLPLKVAQIKTRLLEGAQPSSKCFHASSPSFPCSCL